MLSRAIPLRRKSGSHAYAHVKADARVKVAPAGLTGKCPTFIQHASDQFVRLPSSTGAGLRAAVFRFRN